MMSTMPKSYRPVIHVPAKDQPLLAAFEVAAARQGKKPNEVIGEAMKLWLDNQVPVPREFTPKWKKPEDTA